MQSIFHMLCAKIPSSPFSILLFLFIFFQQDFHILSIIKTRHQQKPLYLFDLCCAAALIFFSCVLVMASDVGVIGGGAGVDDRDGTVLRL